MSRLGDCRLGCANNSMRVTQAQIGKDTSLHRAGVQEIAAGRLLIAILYNKRAWRQRRPAQLRPIMDYERAAIKQWPSFQQRRESGRGLRIVRRRFGCDIITIRVSKTHPTTASNDSKRENLG